MWSTLFPLLILLNLALIGGGVFYVLSHPREPRAMLAWILAFIALPLIGVLLFYLLSDPSLNRRHRRFAKYRKKLNPALWSKLRSIHDAHAPDRHFDEASSELRKFVELATRISSLQPPTTENAVTIYHDQAGQIFERLQQAILSAEHQVHMEYFTFRADQFGTAIAEALMKQAQAGVECRLLVDHLGSWGWPAAFLDKLLQAGVEVRFFLPLLPWRGRRWGLRPNSRNHRKIAVIDGCIGFVGSQNIGDEYLGRGNEFSGWIDTHLELAGPSVYQLQETFIEDWHIAGGGDLFNDRSFPDLSAAPGNQITQIVSSGPDDNAGIMHHLLLAAISAADHSVCIASPYFVPDAAMVLMLEAAAYRGVTVQLLVPRQSDHRIALWAGRSYYQELSRTGVEIYEYTLGFLHSKLVIIDQCWGMVGSANMDERSFRLNFEITAILYTAEPVRQLQQDFENMLNQSQHVEFADKPVTLLTRIKMGAARLLSPIY